jgi:hypothetical protein
VLISLGALQKLLNFLTATDLENADEVLISTLSCRSIAALVEDHSYIWSSSTISVIRRVSAKRAFR